MTTRTSPATANRFPRRLLPPMMLGAILNPINSSIIAVALVPIAAAFGAPASDTAWLVSALYLATAVGQPLVGRFVDLYGPRRVFLVGATLTGIAGILGTAAPNLGVLIAARVILGLGTCAGYPSAMALIRRVADRQGLASPAGVLTILSVTVQTISVIGPTVGGLLIDIGGWRTTMAVNIPLGIACIVLGLWTLPKDDPGDGSHGIRTLDWSGVALFTAALTALLLFLMDPSAAKLWALGVAVVAGTGFAVRELRGRDPFIGVRMLAGNAPLLATYLRALAASTTSYSFIYGFAQWLEHGRGLSATVAGLVLVPSFGIGILVSSIFGRRPRVHGNLLVGGAVQVVVSVLLLWTASDSDLWFLLAIAALLGIPQGLVSLSNQQALFHQADAATLGASSGLMRTFQYLGAILASAASGLAFGPGADTAGMHELAVFMICASALGLVVTIVDPSLRRLSARLR